MVVNPFEKSNNGGISPLLTNNPASSIPIITALFRTGPFGTQERDHGVEEIVSLGLNTMFVCGSDSVHRKVLSTLKLLRIQS